MSKVLIIVDPSDSLEDWLVLVQAAKRLGPVTAFLAGSKETLDAAVQQLPIEQWLWVDDTQLNDVSEHLSESLLPFLAEYDYLLSSTSVLGRNLLPRLIGAFGGVAVTGVVDILNPQAVNRLSSASQVIETVALPVETLIALTIATTSFSSSIDPVNDEEKVPVNIQSITPRYALQEITVSPVKEDIGEQPLETAKIVVGCGLGVSQLPQVDQLVEKLQSVAPTARGATRSFVDHHHVPLTQLIGQTGKSVSPNIYLALGVSGASQHMSGVRDAKMIIAINRDAQAPIFQAADYGLVGDLETILPQLIAHF